MINKRHSKSHDLFDIFHEVMASNSTIDCDDLCYICDKNEKIVGAWIDGSSEIDGFSLMQIYTALYAAKMNIPLSLVQFQNSHDSRAKYWGQKNRTDEKKPAVGKVGTPLAKYLFRGKLKTVYEISNDKRCFVGKNTLRSRIKVRSVLAGEDVTDLAAMSLQQGKKLGL